MTEQKPFIKPGEQGVVIQDSQPARPEVIRRYELDRDRIARALIAKGILSESDYVVGAGQSIAENEERYLADRERFARDLQSSGALNDMDLPHNLKLNR